MLRCTHERELARRWELWVRGGARPALHQRAGFISAKERQHQWELIRPLSQRKQYCLPSTAVPCVPLKCSLATTQLRHS